MPYDARPKAELSKHDRALVVAAAVVRRYQSTAYEADAIRIFERIERKHAARSRLQDAK